jgi:hypothetical protein
MSDLLRIELRVQGEFRDAWVYKGHLHLWDREGILRWTKLETVVKHISAHYGSTVANLTNTLIARNDWKVGEQFNSWMRVPEVSRSMLRPFEGRSHLVIDVPRGIFNRSDSESYAGLVLDTSIYADRVYLATAEGLLESYINSRHPENTYPLNQQTDFRASHVAVKYSAINVSAEHKGLHFAPVRFWTGDEAPGFMPAEWRQVADFSISSSFAKRNLLNYTRSPVPSLLRSKVEEHRTERARYDDTSVVGYESSADISSLMYSAATTEARVSSRNLRTPTLASIEDFEVLGNSDYHLLVSRAGRLGVIDLRAEAGKDVEARPSRRFIKSRIESADVNQVLATYPVSSGFVVESYDRLDLITADGSFVLANGESAQVRTFDSSIRHKEVVAVVNEFSASVFGYYIAPSADDDVTLF